ncbi:MAG TPA: hypothetical protein VIZ90_12100 [Rhizobiaceae bacterium]
MIPAVPKVLALHVTRKGRTGNETVAMATDLVAPVAPVALAAYLLYVWIG